MTCNEDCVRLGLPYDKLVLPPVVEELEDPQQQNWRCQEKVQ